MRAVMTRRGTLSVEEVPQPVPGPGEVLVRTLACGICGSDLHAFQHADRMRETYQRTGTPLTMDLDQGVVFGHEFSAEVVEYGPGTEKTLAEGTQVCAMPIAFGSHGPETVGYSNRYPGGYGQYMVIQKDLMLPIPNGLPAELAALTEPMAVGAHAVARAELTKDHVSLIIGCGPVGLAVLLSLKAQGFGPVIAADFSAGRRAMAEHLGADSVIDPARVSPFSKWAEFGIPMTAGEKLTALLTGETPRPAAIFECVGVPGVIQQILEGAPLDARVIVAGVCMETDHFEPLFAITKEVDLRFVLGYSAEEFAGSLHGIAEGLINAGPMVTGMVGLQGVASAFDALARPDEHIKILIDPSQR